MIAAVTNFYDPDRRGIKMENFKRMRDGLRGLPLYVVEAVFGDQSFQLPEGDGHIKVRCPDLLWQQYRLVDFGIRSLPDRYDKAVWIDADILFTEDWADRMAELLDRYKVVQSYGEILLGAKGGVGGDLKEGVVKRSLAQGKLDLSVVYATGFSWGVRREVVEEHGIYDRWITGSDDIAWVTGIWGDWDNKFMRSRLNKAMRDHYLKWAEPFNRCVGGSVGYLDTRIVHLWHGHRNYKKRWACLNDYDPATDVTVENGALVWASHKPHLHDCCANMCSNYDIEFKPYL
jgi:hypothetical protein